MSGVSAMPTKKAADTAAIANPIEMGFFTCAVDQSGVGPMGVGRKTSVDGGKPRACLRSVTTIV